MRIDEDGDLLYQLKTILNGGIEFGDNVRGGFVEVTTTGGVQSVEHNLGYVPIGYLVLLLDAECTIWAANLESWTGEILYLDSSVANVTVRLFVL